MPARTPSSRRLVRRKPSSSSAGTPASSAGGGRASAPACASTGCGCRWRGVSVAQPRVPVRREHRERRAGLRQHFVALEDHLVLERAKRDALRARAHRRRRRRARARRLVVVIGEDRGDAELARRGAGSRRARAHGARSAPPPRARSARISSRDAVVDELDAPVVGRAAARRGSRGRTRTRSRPAPRAAQRVRERRVVEVAQVAAEPDERPGGASGVGGRERLGRAGDGRHRRRADRRRWRGGYAERHCARRPPFTIRHHGCDRQPHPPLPDRHAGHGRSAFRPHADVRLRAQRGRRARHRRQQADRHDAVRAVRADQRPAARPALRERAGALRRPGADRPRLRAAPAARQLAVDARGRPTTSGSRRRRTSSRRVGRGEGPRDVLVSLGYAGWSAGQLEQELAQNAWLTVDGRCRRAVRRAARAAAARGDALLGIDFSRLSDDVGHA